MRPGTSARARRSDQERADDRHGQDHVDGRVRQRDVRRADLEDRPKFRDLKLMDRVDHRGFRSSSARSPEPRRRLANSRFGALGLVGSAGKASGPHHVQHARTKAEQQEHHQPPRRGVKPAVEQPAHQRSDQHAGDEFGRKPKAAGETGIVRPRSRSWIRALRPARSDAVEPFTEAPQPCRESSLVGGSRTGILVARTHDRETRNGNKSRCSATPKAARTILVG